MTPVQSLMRIPSQKVGAILIVKPDSFKDKPPDKTYSILKIVVETGELRPSWGWGVTLLGRCTGVPCCPGTKLHFCMTLFHFPT